jgi:hypothetical protein
MIRKHMKNSDHRDERDVVDLGEATQGFAAV